MVHLGSVCNGRVVTDVYPLNPLIVASVSVSEVTRGGPPYAANESVMMLDGSEEYEYALVREQDTPERVWWALEELRANDMLTVANDDGEYVECCVIDIGKRTLLTFCMETLNYRIFSEDDESCIRCVNGHGRATKPCKNTVQIS